MLSFIGSYREKVVLRVILILDGAAGYLPIGRDDFPIGMEIPVL